MTQLIDITHYIDNEMTVWPGDTPADITPTRVVGEGSRSTVSKLVLNSHTGTHIDAPAHFIANGRCVDALSLDVLIGKCVVVQTDADSISDEVLDGMSIPLDTRRLLIKTRNSARFTGDEPFFKDYVGVTTRGAKWLVSRGIQLVGIDYMSIAAHPDIQPVHHLLLGKEIVLLESLDLSAVAPGTYRLIALPLKLKGCDGSPARAVLAPL
jgi:arylformamidase